MEQKLFFEKITDKQLKALGIQALGNRPNASGPYGQGGMSPEALKAWFDQVPALLAKKINELQEAISGEYACKYIGIALEGYDSLEDLVTAMTDGSFASKIMMAYPSADSKDLDYIQDIIYGFAKELSEANEDILKLDKDVEKLDEKITEFGEKIENGDFDGSDGISPTITVTEIVGGHRLTITDAAGTKIVDVMNGKTGDKGEAGADGSIADYDIITSLNTTDYKLTVSLVDAGGKVVSSSVVDFPLESVVVDGEEEGGIVTLTLQNGNTITFDISDLVDGLVSQTKHDEDIAALGARIDALEESGVASADLTELDTLIGEGV